ncbi:MerR family transcriptional regulator [Halobacteriovorax sp.]|uniref:MerR family transcriptional regulator n=1 Tax=Halobacteriovorax sp. TaxID=2020862 RepID=UPI003562EB61
MKNSVGIKVLSKACGVLPHSIRTWEKRYQAFTPERTEGGQRLYSFEDLERATLIGDLLNQGHAISKVGMLSLEELTTLSEASGDVKEDSSYWTDVSISKLFEHLSKYAIDEVVSELQHLRMNCGAKEFIFKVVLPVMQEIGMKVSKGDFSVTQEHIVSTIIRDQLAQLALPNFLDSNNRVALATPDGNLHELSILIADIICRSNRVSTSYLGASHPAVCLGEAVNALKINTIIMGVVSSDKWDYEKNMVHYLSELDKHLTIETTVILGGGWDLDFPRFKKIKEVRVIKDFQTFDKLILNPNFFLNAYL